jgi:predicted peroxiredoxin
MKKVAYLFVITILMVACTAGEEKQNASGDDKTIQQENVKDGMLIHITEGYDDAHRVLMPMKMAAMMAEDKDVILYLDIDAVKLVVKDAEDLNHDGFDSFRTYVKKLNEMNVGIYACPTCLKVAGFESADLMEGVKVAEKEKFFNFTEGNVITLDY